MHLEMDVPSLEKMASVQHRLRKIVPGNWSKDDPGDWLWAEAVYWSRGEDVDWSKTEAVYWSTFVAIDWSRALTVRRDMTNLLEQRIERQHLRICPCS